MVTTTLINSSGVEVVLKEGNAGVYSIRATLGDGRSYKLRVDPNATYREFWIGGGGLPQGVIFIVSSDDCFENSVVELRPAENSSYELKFTSRRKNDGGSSSQGGSGWFTRFFKTLLKGDSSLS